MSNPDIKGCIRCGIISTANQQNQRMEVPLSEIVYLGSGILACPLCLNEIRAVNIRKFEDDFPNKNLS